MTAARAVKRIPSSGYWMAPSNVLGSFISLTAWAKDWTIFLTFRFPLSFLRTLTMCFCGTFLLEVLVVGVLFSCLLRE